MLNPRKYPNSGAILVMLLTALGTTILSTSRLPLLEQSVCRSYYQSHEPAIIGKDGSVPEMRCKEIEIQTELAGLRGWAEFFGDVPGLILTVSYGRLAETSSKKLILGVNTVSYVLSILYFLAVCYFYERFDIKMIWLSCLFDIFGGGSPILRTLLYTFIAEGTDPVSLSSTYYALSASLLATKLFGMTTGTYLLERGIWIPCQVGLLVYSLGIPALLLLPSSLPVNAGEETDNSHSQLLPEEGDPRSDGPWSAWKFYLVAQFRAITVDYTKSFHVAMELFIHDRLYRLCLAIFFFNITGMGVRIVLQQWASKFFKWTLAETSYVLSFELLVSGLVLVSLPYISKRLLKPMLGSTRRTDLWVVKASLLINIVGALCIGFAPTKIFFVVSLTIYSTGAGLYDSLKSFATGFLRREEITRLYVGISLVETVGSLIAGPLWSGIFSLALSVNFLGYGLPFWLCSLCFICAFTTVLFLERHLEKARLPMSW
ncbi:hypothetical protein RUND412_003701 [Rhizina undulata]